MGFWKRLLNRITPTQGISGPRRGFFSKTAMHIGEDTSMQVSAFHRGVVYISTQIAKLPWDVKDRENNIIENPKSLLLNLLPNPEMNAFSWRLVMVMNAIIHGNAYAEIERDYLGQPIALWPLRSQDIEITRTRDGQLVYKVGVGPGNPYATYDDGFSDGGVYGRGYVYMKPADVFHLKNFHTKDGLVGQGVVAYATETLGISYNADRMASGLFNNAGIPSGVLIHPGELSDEAYKRIKASWDEQHGGKKVGGTAVLEEGVEYKAINLAPDVLQFLESRQFNVLEVARFLGVPPTKLFDVTAATYSNVENANLEVATDTLDSWAVNLELEADVKILNKRYGGMYSEIDIREIFRGDSKSRSDYYKNMMSVAAMTPNQIRRREGMPGYGVMGDNYYVATNNYTPVNRMNELIDADIKQKEKSAAPPKPAAKTVEDKLNEAAIDFLSK